MVMQEIKLPFSINFGRLSIAVQGVVSESHDQ